MKQVTINVYQFNELNEYAKQKAIENFRYFNVENIDWWSNTYEDAKNIGLKITSFDLERNRHAKGEFINDADFCANEILANHGKESETYKTAANYLDERNKLNIDAQEDVLNDLDDDFLSSILEDYSIILQNECEYLQSDEVIIDTIEANEYEFNEDGTRF